jgi:hypothetical protein
LSAQKKKVVKPRRDDIMNTLKRTLVGIAGGLGILSLAASGAWAGEAEGGKAQTGQGEHAQHGQKSASAAAGTTAKLDAVLVEPEKKAQGKAATIKVTVEGVKIVDPAVAGEKPIAGQGHLHYTVDDNPTVATTTTKLSFHGLSSGKHTIKVVLAGNDHSPLGPEETLEVNVP